MSKVQSKGGGSSSIEAPNWGSLFPDVSSHQPRIAMEVAVFPTSLKKQLYLYTQKDIIRFSSQSSYTSENLALYENYSPTGMSTFLRNVFLSIWWRSRVSDLLAMALLSM